jgi:hypothetical protein
MAWKKHEAEDGRRKTRHFFGSWYRSRGFYLIVDC